MLEIIVLIFLTRHIGRIAAEKGLKPGTWKLYTVLAWIAGEIIGVIAGAMIFGPELFPIMLVAIGGAVAGYHILKNNLTKRPGLNRDIDQIGNIE